MLKFLFINIFAFLLLALGIIFFILPFEIFLHIFKYVLSILFIAAAVNIFIQWKRKQRIIELLLKRNENEFNKDSFKPFMETFCSQMAVIYVLIKIGHIDKLKILYSELFKGSSGNSADE